MKKVIIIIGIAITLFVILIATKPSDESCKQRFKEDAKNMILKQFVINDSTSIDTISNPKKKEAERKFHNSEMWTNILMTSANNISNEKWEDAISINDNFFYKKITVKWINDKKEIHYGFLNFCI